MSSPLDSNVLLTKYVECTSAELIFFSVNTNTTVRFNAFLTDFDQTFSSNWNTEEVFGRMDPIANFRSTKRSISLAWVVPATTAVEAKTNLINVSILAQMLYPTYAAEESLTQGQQPPQGQGGAQGGQGGAQGGGQPQPRQTPLKLKGSAHTQTLSRPPLIKLKYANLIEGLNGHGQLGWIENFTFRPNLDMGFFVEDKKLYPKSINVSCNFNVLHQQNVGFSSGNKFLGQPYFPFGKTKS